MHRRILFRLVRDADGYPPADVESVWARELDDGSFEIDTIPFFTREVALGDVVEAEERDGALYYNGTRKASNNSLIRVIVGADRDSAALRAELSRMGCSSEQSHVPSLFSLNVPGDVSLERVCRWLEHAHGAGILDYEEAILRQ